MTSTGAVFLKKLMAFTLTLAAVLAGGGWYFFLRGDGVNQAPVSVVSQLSGEQTASVSGLSGLNTVVADLDAVIRQLPAELLASLPPALDPGRRIQAIGFAADTAEGWATIGVDPELGVAVVFDGRVHAAGHGLPIGLLRVEDEGLLIPWIEARVGAPLGLEGPEGGVRRGHIAERSMLVGRRGGLTAVVLGSEAAVTEAAAGFAAFLKDGQTPRLDGDPELKALLDGAPKPRLYGFVDGDGTVALTYGRGASEARADDAAYYGALFPGAGLMVDGDTARLRLFTSAAAHGLLTKLLSPKTRSPKFSRHLHGESWAAVRLSVNLVEGFDALAALMPPSSGLKQKLGLLKIAMPFSVGFGWDEIATALSGHVVEAVDLNFVKRFAAGAPRKPRWLLMLGVADTEALDRLLPKALGLVDKFGKGATVEPFESGDLQGHHLRVRGRDIYIVRVAEILLVAPTVSILVEAAVPAQTPRADAEVLDGTAAVGLSVDVSPALAAGGAMASLKGALASSAGRAVAASPRLTAQITLDSLGLTGHLGAGQLRSLPVWTALGMAATFQLLGSTR